MDNFKPNHKTPPAATNPTPVNNRPGVANPMPSKGNAPAGGQAGWQKNPQKKTG